MVKQGLACWINLTTEQRSCSILAILRSRNFLFLYYVLQDLTVFFFSSAPNNFLPYLQEIFISLVLYLYLASSLEPTKDDINSLLHASKDQASHLGNRRSFLITAPHHLRSYGLQNRIYPRRHLTYKSALRDVLHFWGFCLSLFNSSSPLNTGEVSCFRKGRPLERC